MQSNLIPQYLEAGIPNSDASQLVTWSTSHIFRLDYKQLVTQFLNKTKQCIPCLLCYIYIRRVIHFRLNYHNLMSSVVSETLLEQRSVNLLSTVLTDPQK